jgi:hypothetical protein
MFYRQNELRSARWSVAMPRDCSRWTAQVVRARIGHSASCQTCSTGMS